MGKRRNVYNILVGKTEGKRPLEILIHKWKDNVIMDLKEIGLEGVDWIHIAQDRDWWRDPVNMVMNLWFP
jgi:hypothetical protein